MLDIVKLKFEFEYPLAAVPFPPSDRSGAGGFSPLRFLGQHLSEIDRMSLTPVCRMEFYGAIC